MLHVTKMLTQTKCDLTEALFLFLKVTGKIHFFSVAEGYTNIHKQELVSNHLSTV